MFVSSSCVADYLTEERIFTRINEIGLNHFLQGLCQMQVKTITQKFLSMVPDNAAKVNTLLFSDEDRFKWAHHHQIDKKIVSLLMLEFPESCEDQNCPLSSIHQLSYGFDWEISSKNFYVLLFALPGQYDPNDLMSYVSFVLDL